MASATSPGGQRARFRSQRQSTSANRNWCPDRECHGLPDEIAASTSWKSSPARMAIVSCSTAGLPLSLPPIRIASRIHAAAEESARWSGTGALPHRRPGDPNMSRAPQGFENQRRDRNLITTGGKIGSIFRTSQTARWPSSIPPCGYFSAQQLGMYMLRSQKHGTRLLAGRVEGVSAPGIGSKRCASPRAGGTTSVSTRHFVNAAGPFLPRVAAWPGWNSRVHELHIKVAFRDPLRKVARTASFAHLSDPTFLPGRRKSALCWLNRMKPGTCSTEFPPGGSPRPEEDRAAMWS